ncbi:sugar-binding transcriptional regulator [Oceanobacillus chungangensis]|uniref:Uncharacterized protein n=1 Tax=Oceanobacillus chungangensis TaxID=1229152 RepID=A0A3D8PLW9_9BACI|nr:sugar-binding domain-containing protein [Oceanobacillus chungangensis]RDW17080.1 hypothetical protein CWR45_13180 [Oceanobacillus chungangensis]
MGTFTDLQKKLVPDLLEIMQQRYSILQSIDLFEPIGRRGLAENTNLTERHIRGEVEFLQKQELIQVTSKGMFITKEGKLILDQLAKFMGELMGLNVLEEQLKGKLGLKKVLIIPGNSDENDWVKREMGKACVSFLQTIVKKQMIIAVTGGTTMAAVANAMTPLNKSKDYLFLPARGAIGEKAENQSNRIVTEMAERANGDYRLLNVPDPLSETAYQTLVKEPSIQDVLTHIKNADIVIHGIGDAITMAKRRKTSEKVIEKLQTNAAVSEAFGYYFDEFGNIIHKVRTLGIQLEDLVTMDHVLAIAGGKSKAKAIVSYFQQGKSDLLITDEAAAKQILRG